MVSVRERTIAKKLTIHGVSLDLVGSCDDVDAFLQDTLDAEEEPARKPRRAAEVQARRAGM